MDEDLKSASDSLDYDTTDKPAYSPSVGKSKKHIPKWLVVMVLTVLGVSAFAFVGFNIANRKHVNPKNSNFPDTNATAPTATTAEDVPDATLSEKYSSTALNVAFKYPKAWKVSETSGSIRIDSPTFSYPAVNLGSIDGLFRIYIRQGARPIDGKYIGDGLAIKPSEKLTYTQPSNDQRPDTLLSAFGSNSTDIFTFFLIAGNFQLNKGDTLGPNYGREADAYIVAGGYTTKTAIDDLAMSSVATDYYATTKAYKLALQTVASLQLN